MTGDHDDDDTFSGGYQPPEALPPTRPRRRVESQPLGIPVYVPDQPSRRSSTALIAADDSGPIGGTLDQRVEALERRASGQRRLVRGALVGAVGSVGAVLVWALSAREAAGAEKAQLRALEDAVRELRSVVWSLWRRDDQPDPAPRPAAPSTPPAPKGTAP